jgi:hypothetical protein
LGEIDGERPDKSGVIINLCFRGGPHYEVFELGERAAEQSPVLQTLEKLSLPVYVFRYESQGRTGLEFQGDKLYANNCPFGHGEGSGRVSLPILPEELQPQHA